jgi:hypothetical protein
LAVIPDTEEKDTLETSVFFAIIFPPKEKFFLHLVFKTSVSSKGSSGMMIGQDQMGFGAFLRAETRGFWLDKKLFQEINKPKRFFP